MPVTAKRARELALALPNTTEAPHFDRIAFKTPRRTFATLAGDGSDINFMFDLVTQERFCDLAPGVISPVPGGWGRMGATQCLLGKVTLKVFREALLAAHARANEVRAKSKR